MEPSWRNNSGKALDFVSFGLSRKKRRSEEKIMNTVNYLENAFFLETILGKVINFSYFGISKFCRILKI
jgi:hypothetical protein